MTPRHSDLNVTGDWTIEAWFKHEMPGGFNQPKRYVMLQGETGVAGDASYLLAVERSRLTVGERTGWSTWIVSYAPVGHQMDPTDGITWLR